MNSFDPRVELAKLQPASESGRGMAVAVGNAWVRFLRNYGPIPNNDNMYDEHIRRKIKRHKIKPIELPAPFLKELLENFERALPDSYFLTGTAGDGKTYHCREVFAALGGSEEDWNGGIGRLANALATNGVFFMSFKYGDEQRMEPDGRRFTDLNEVSLSMHIHRQPRLRFNSMWVFEGDSTAGKTAWLNALTLRKPKISRKRV